MGLGIGPLELGVVLLVALLVFGPHRLPELMRTAGRAVAEFRRATGQMTTDLSETALNRPPTRPRPPTLGTTSSPEYSPSAPPSEPR